MVIVGLDQAPIGIGFAYGEPGGRPTFGYHQNGDYDDNTARLRKHVREWLVNLIKSAGIERIYFEQIIVRKHGLHMPTLHKQFAVVGGIETAAEMLGLIDDCYETMIADWRREFYAGSRPTKGQDDESASWKDMARVECARRGWLTDNHNIAEALGIWDFGCACTDKIYKVRAGLTKRRQQSAADERRRAGL
jgi:hypothetical protein